MAFRARWGVLLFAPVIDLVYRARLGRQLFLISVVFVSLWAHTTAPYDSFGSTLLLVLVCGRDCGISGVCVRCQCGRSS